MTAMSMTRKPRHRAETTPGNAAQTIGRGFAGHRRDAEEASEKAAPENEPGGERAAGDVKA
jgi:hypothetical protein